MENEETECTAEETETTTEERVISEDDAKKLAADSEKMTDFKRNKLEREAQKNWDLFYKRNAANFFKDRHWTSREFKNLCPEVDFTQKHVILEAGCGVGNFILPFLAEFRSWRGYACDFSRRAVEHLKSSDSLPGDDRCSAFICDLTLPEGDLSLANNVPESALDFVSLIFVLSAIHPDKMATVVDNIYKVVGEGGSVLVRDYGLYDHAQLRFGTQSKIGDNFYVRQDGTRAYYFSIAHLRQLFESAGFECVSCTYVRRITRNRKENLQVDRVFVQARFRKPSSSTSQLSNGTNHHQQQQQQNGCHDDEDASTSSMALSPPPTDTTGNRNEQDESLGQILTICEQNDDSLYPSLLRLRARLKQRRKGRGHLLAEAEFARIRRLCHIHWEGRQAEPIAAVFGAVLPLLPSTHKAELLDYYVRRVPWHVKGRYRLLAALVAAAGDLALAKHVDELCGQLEQALAFQHTATCTAGVIVALAQQLHDQHRQALVRFVADTATDKHAIRQTQCVRVWVSSALCRKAPEFLVGVGACLCERLAECSQTRHMPGVCALHLTYTGDHADQVLCWSEHELHVYALLQVYKALQFKRLVVPENVIEAALAAAEPGIRLLAAECVVTTIVCHQQWPEADYERINEWLVQHTVVRDSEFRQHLCRLLQTWLSFVRRQRVSQAAVAVEHLLSGLLHVLGYDCELSRLTVLCRLLDMPDAQWAIANVVSPELRARLERTVCWHVIHNSSAHLRLQLAAHANMQAAELERMRATMQRVAGSAKTYDIAHAQLLLSLVHNSSGSTQPCTACDAVWIQQIQHNASELQLQTAHTLLHTNCHGILALMAQRLSLRGTAGCTVMEQGLAAHHTALFTACVQHIDCVLQLVTDDAQHTVNPGAVMQHLAECSEQAGSLWARAWITLTAASQLCLQLVKLRPQHFTSYFNCLVRVLTAVTHKGVLDDCCAHFTQLCSLNDEDHTELLNSTINEVVESVCGAASKYTYTRDFALSTIVSALLSSLHDKSVQAAALDGIVARLCGASETADMRVAGPVVACVKLLTCLCTQAQHLEVYKRHLCACVRLAVAGFASPSWPVRSAASQLLAALMYAVFGRSEVSELSSAGRLTLTQFTASHDDVWQWCVRQVCQCSSRQPDREQRQRLYAVLTVLCSIRVVHDTNEHSSQLHELQLSLWRLLLACSDVRRANLLLHTVIALTPPSRTQALSSRVHNILDTTAGLSLNQQRALNSLLLAMDDRPSVWPTPIVHNRLQALLLLAGQPTESDVQLVTAAVFEHTYGLSAACIALPLALRWAIQLDASMSCVDALMHRAVLFGRHPSCCQRRHSCVSTLQLLLAQPAHFIQAVAADLRAELLVLIGRLMLDEDVEVEQRAQSLAAGAGGVGAGLASGLRSVHRSLALQSHPAVVLQAAVAELAVDVSQLSRLCQHQDSFQLDAVDFNADAECSTLWRALHALAVEACDQIRQQQDDMSLLHDTMHMLQQYVHAVLPVCQQYINQLLQDELVAARMVSGLHRVLLVSDVHLYLLRASAYDPAGAALHTQQALGPLRVALQRFTGGLNNVV